MRVLAWPARKNADRNPYQKLLYDAIETFEDVLVTEFTVTGLFHPSKPDVLHLHWPDVYLAGADNRRFLFWLRLAMLHIALRIASLRKIKVVWTAHNMRRAGQKNGELLERHFWPWFLRRIDAIIYLTDQAARQAVQQEKTLLGKPWAVIPHGHYRPVLSQALPSPPAGGPARALMFGSITHYKQPHHLVSALGDIPPGQVAVVIAGKFSQLSPSRKLTEVIRLLPPRTRPWLTVRDEFLSPSDLLNEMRAADVAVFPYTDVLSSGAAIYALSTGRVILTSDLPVFRELQQLVPGDWVQIYSDKLTPQALLEAARRGREVRLRNEVPDLEALSWERISRATTTFYSKVVTQ